MAFNPAPSAWLGAGYSLGTNQAIFNTSNHASACLSALDNTEANATTGDIRSIAFAVTDQLYQGWLATEVADRPARMTISRTTSEDAEGNLVRQISFLFYLDPGTGLDVIDE